MRLAKLHNDAIIPTRGSKSAAGYDLYCYEDITLFPITPTIIPIGISLAIPQNHYGQIAARSSMGAKGIIVLGGVIDSDYRGEIKVCLISTLMQSPVTISKGSRIAQLLIIPIHTPEIVELPVLDTTERGEKGFGSTGA